MRIDNKQARTCYLTESKAENWSVRLLQRHINTNYYEKLLSSLISELVTGKIKVTQADGIMILRQLNQFYINRLYFARLTNKVSKMESVE